MGLIKIVGEKDWSRFVERRTRILEIGGDISAIVDTSAGPNHGFRIPAIGQPQSRRDIIAIDRNRAGAGRCKNRGADQWSQTRDRDAGAAAEIRECLPVVAFRVGSAPFVARPEVQREFRIHLPIILNIEARFLRLVRNRGFDVQGASTVVAKAQQETGEVVTLGDDAVARLPIGSVLTEAEQPGGIVWLPEIVKK